MIYLKRLWNVLAIMIAMCISFVSLPLVFIEVTIVAPLCYIVTGKFYMNMYFPIAYYMLIWIFKNITIKID